jgi:hypothetical protein
MVVEAPLRKIVPSLSSIPDSLLQMHQLLARLVLFLRSLYLQSLLISSCENFNFKLVIFRYHTYVLPVVLYFVFDLYAL